MPEYIVNLWLDGYDTEEEMEKACDEFIYDQLNFTASSVQVKRSDYTALVEAVRWWMECYWFDRWLDHFTLPITEEWTRVVYCSRAAVDALVGER